MDSFSRTRLPPFAAPYLRSNGIGSSVHPSLPLVRVARGTDRIPSSPTHTAQASLVPCVRAPLPCVRGRSGSVGLSLRRFSPSFCFLVSGVAVSALRDGLRVRGGCESVWRAAAAVREPRGAADEHRGAADPVVLGRVAVHGVPVGVHADDHAGPQLHGDRHWRHPRRRRLLARAAQAHGRHGASGARAACLESALLTRRRRLRWSTTWAPSRCWSCRWC